MKFIITVVAIIWIIGAFFLNVWYYGIEDGSGQWWLTLVGFSIVGMLMPFVIYRKR